jgi:hypothetical protein
VISVEDASAGYVSGVENQDVSPIPGAERWSYGAFELGEQRGSITVPLSRDDGKSAAFTVPDFVSDPEDIRRIAVIVTSALEKWEDVKGLGA